MLNAKTDRLDYGEQLIPPDDDYDLDYAVGTTYSLDLEAIMVLPVAMFYSRLLDCSTEDLHFDVLDAITRSAEKIRVYCQKGKIKVPKKYNSLMAYWENGICEIRMQSHVSSFHPKVWVVRFTAQDKPAFYRLLITSRNLTYAHDWDIAFSSEGYCTDKYIDRNKPLIEFLQFLETQDNNKFPGKFIEELNYVDFELPDGFRLMTFHLIGFNLREDGTGYVNPLSKRTWDDMLIISPFIDTDSIDTISSKTENSINILSRREELDKIDEAYIENIGVNNFYQFSEFIKHAEDYEEVREGSTIESRLQNLHAKTYISSKNDYYYWFIGSANCTNPAFERNIEFLVELKSENSKLSPVKIFKSLTEIKADELPLFDKYQLSLRTQPGEEANHESVLRKMIYDITGLKFKGILESRDTGAEVLYDIVIECDTASLSVPDDYQLKIRPLPEFNKEPVVLFPGSVNSLTDFKGYNEVNLSPYLQVSIYYKGIHIKSFVVEMEIDLPETRVNKIFRSIIDNRYKFLKYLTFLLSGTTPEPVSSPEKGGNSTGANGDNPNNNQAIPIYEYLLIAASRRPERLKSLENIIKRLEEHENSEVSVISEDFMRLWIVFKEHLNRVSK